MAGFSAALCAACSSPRGLPSSWQPNQCAARPAARAERHSSKRAHRQPLADVAARQSFLGEGVRARRRAVGADRVDVPPQPGPARAEASTSAPKPTVRPANPCFGSGPCSKRPGYSLGALSGALLGRSHRSKAGQARLMEACERTRAVLGIPDDYLVGILPGSDTGAFEAALWNLLGPRPVDVLHWESFGAAWRDDVVNELRLPDVREHGAPYGALPDLSAVRAGEADLVFPYNGTTSGVMVPGLEWVPADRAGLVLCDATSAVFSLPLDWAKVDALTFSWQKALGGEAAHGVLVLSPRAVERLESHAPAWPVPRLLRLARGGRLARDLFERAAVLNTPSMLADYLDALRWAEAEGGAAALAARTRRSFEAVEAWVARTPWADFLASDPATRSPTSVCLRLPEAAEPAATAKRMVALLEEEGVAYDIGAYRDAPPGLRIWCGATVEAEDVRRLLPWLDWAYPLASGAAP
eukprot:tig00000310_g23955.t1